MSALLLDSSGAAAVMAEMMPFILGFILLTVALYISAVIIFIKSKSGYWRAAAFLIAAILTILGIYGIKSPETDLDVAFSLLFIPIAIGVITEYLLRRRRITV